MNYLIRRQDAIQALDGELTITGKENAVAVTDYLNTVRKRLENLPPVDGDIIELSERFLETAYEWGKENAQTEWIPVTERYKLQSECAELKTQVSALLEQLNKYHCESNEKTEVNQT